MDENAHVLRLGTILVVNEDLENLSIISEALQQEGYRVLEASDDTKARILLQQTSVDALITELLPRTDGLRLPRIASVQTPPVPVVVVTDYATVETAVEAIKIGAVDYLPAPLNLENLKQVVGRVMDLHPPVSEPTGDAQSLNDLLSVSPNMHAVFRQIRQVAQLKSTVLITGESGTGKDLVARAIHSIGPRNKGSFIAVNCSSLTDELFESQFFGHEKGAFAGASSTRKGFFETAHQGTLFLDGIDGLDLQAQAKLLRTLEDRQVLRLGNPRPIPVDVRLLASSSTDLEVAVANRNFREDLYYRLQAFTIVLPPLRERASDIPHLARLFLEQFTAENSLDTRILAPDALAVLTTYVWPGNVRELKNTIEALVLAVNTPNIRSPDLPKKFQESFSESDISAFSVGMSMEDIEKDVIERTLQHTEGNRTQAAKLLKIGLRTLQRKMKRYSLS